ncbi:MAG: hypothetical protein HUN04_19135 [Desulfobacter sp.]|nr:MAG: hypothetical protein HUN04_19135 [Desulfobacter sp.]
MNGLSQINPGGLRQHGGYGAMSSSTTAVNSYESLNAGLTIQTREGDIVTLSASMFSELDANEYTSQGEFAGKRGSVSAAYNEREITLSTGEAFTFTVKGDLSEEELEDIEAIVSGVDAIIGEMAEGDMADAVSKALSMGTYDSISQYEADISMERAYAVYAENSSAAYGRGRGHGYGRSLGPATGQEAVPVASEGESVSFMDKVAALLEEQREETVAWARQPLGQLFSHHLEALETPDDTDATEGVDGVDEGTDGVDELVAAENQPLYQVLEDAAEKVDELINTMMKDLFGNTLDQMI